MAPLSTLFPPGPAGTPTPRDKVWQRRFVAERGLLPQPGFAAVDGTRVGPGGADLGDVLAGRPGAYVLKPRFGSNGCGVVRVVSRPDGTLAAESDCPDTAAYLDDFPADPARRGRDVVAALATGRGRYLDRARAGIPEAALGLSILEDEIPADRAGGSVFEPRAVVQRTRTGFATVGAVCKRIDTPVGAVVARDFREEELAASLARLLADHAPPADLPAEVTRAHADILAAADRVRAELVPVLEASAVRVHQFGIDGRLCRAPAECGLRWVFLEFQFGIGRVDVPLPGYRTRADLASEFGPERG